MADWPPVAFIDVETTGLNPLVNRIAEIGVVTADGDEVAEWTTFIAQINGQSRPPRGGADGIVLPSIAAPSFADIAGDLAKRLAGRLLVAHNARFDYAFLKAEFERVRIDFSAAVLCTVMLSRRLYPQHARHDLDSLMDRHRLTASARHRALPDARLLWQFWQTMQDEIGREALAGSVNALLAGPVLPDDLDPSLIDRLPEAPGVYIFRDRDDAVLHIGEARNLRLHLIDYFRLDRASTKALAVAQRVSKIDWRVTQGALGTRLWRVVLANATSAKKGADAAPLYSWQFAPDRHPSLELVALNDVSVSGAPECFGMFRSQRKARNALVRLARGHFLCHGLMGLAESDDLPCLGCAAGGRPIACAARTQRLKHLMKWFDALKPLRLASWPYQGAIGIRERRDVHVFDEWRYLGTAQSDAEIFEALQVRRGGFDPEVYALLAATLPKLPSHRILKLHELLETRCARTHRACEPDSHAL